VHPGKNSYVYPKSLKANVALKLPQKHWEHVKDFYCKAMSWALELLLIFSFHVAFIFQIQLCYRKKNL
jgi:hypothetical protein